MDLREHSLSLVDRLVKQAESICAKPIGFANVIDSRTGDIQMLETVANALVEKANDYGIAIMNGENAILGDRMNCEANVSGTMISIMKKGGWLGEEKSPTVYRNDNRVNFAVFDHQGKPVFINSDGVGTKTEFYERAKRYRLAVEDFIAMNVDDATKIGAVPVVVSGVLETEGYFDVKRIHNHMREVANRLGFLGILQQEKMEGRLNPYKKYERTYNISGSVVSVIDEDRLKNPLVPGELQYLIAIHKEKPNPRSNGITAKRKIMIDWLGNDWHTTEAGKDFLEYLAEPSAILYPIFKELLEKELATSVYHMSGGAFDSKLARPLAEHNMYCFMNQIFMFDHRELELMQKSGTSWEDAYRKWSMGNDGFVTTDKPEETIKVICSFPGFEAKAAGYLINAEDENPGINFSPTNNEEPEHRIRFTGRE